MEPKKKYKLAQRVTHLKSSTFKHRGFCQEVWLVSMENNQSVACDSI